MGSKNLIFPKTRNRYISLFELTGFCLRGVKIRKVVRYLTMEIFQTSFSDRRKKLGNTKDQFIWHAQKQCFFRGKCFLWDRTDTSKMVARISPRKLPNEKDTSFWWKFTTVNFEKSVVAHKNCVSWQNHCFSACQMNWTWVFTELFLLSPTDVC